MKHFLKLCIGAILLVKVKAGCWDGVLKPYSNQDNYFGDMDDYDIDSTGGCYKGQSYLLRPYGLETVDSCLQGSVPSDANWL